MTNEQRFAICKLSRWQNAVGDYPYAYINPKGVYCIYKVDGEDGSWIEKDTQQTMDLVDRQLLQDTISIRDKLSKIINQITDSHKS